MRGMIILLLALTGVGMAQQTQLIYTNLPSDVPPQLRGGRTFVPVRVIAEQFGATVSWLARDSTVLIQRSGAPAIRAVIGSTTARVGGEAVLLDAAPYVDQGRTLVPLRLIAETYNVPIEYRDDTRSVWLTRDDRRYVLPLPSTRAGVIIATPAPNMLVRNPILVQGQANVFEGHLEVEVRDAHGQVLGRTFTTAGMGGFYAFSVPVYYNQPGEDATDGRIVVFSRNGVGNGKILAQDAVPVRLASTL